MISPKARHDLSRILPFGIIWCVAGLIFFVVEQAALGGSGRPTGGVAVDARILLFATLAQTAVGLTVGAIEVYYLDRAFLRKSFPRKLAYKGVFYVVLFAMVTLVTFPVAVALELDVAPWHPLVWRRFGEYLVSPAHASTDLQLAATLAASLFYLEMSDNIGPSTLISFLTGRYHRPAEERRIFLFSDMRSSTAIAERLGHIRYFELLGTYFADLSEAIVAHGGEVYQYVVDEIVVSWRVERGLEDAACVRCCFEMKEDLTSKAERYEREYGVAPTFKAGLHIGPVTTGEIGVLKKDIIFTGDVLNTTARIQSMCKSLDEELLVSGDLMSELELGDAFEVRDLATRELEGRDEGMRLFAVHPPPPLAARLRSGA